MWIRSVTVQSDIRHKAAGDGLTDDTQAIHDALLACADDGGGVVTIPPGAYRFTETLTIGANTTLQGAGQRVTKLLFDGPGVGVEWPGNDDHWCSFAIYDLTVYSERPDSTVGVRLINAKYCELRNVRVAGTYQVAWSEAGIHLAADSSYPGGGWSAGIRLDNCFTTAPGGHGISIDEGGGKMFISGGHYSAAKRTNIYAPAPTGKVSKFSLRDCVVEGAAEHQIYGDSLVGTVIEGSHIENGMTNTHTPISLGQAGACKGIVIQSCSIAGKSASYCINSTAQGTNEGLEVLGCTLTLQDLTGQAFIRLDRTQSAVITSNRHRPIGLPLLSLDQSVKYINVNDSVEGIFVIE